MSVRVSCHARSMSRVCLVSLMLLPSGRSAVSYSLFFFFFFFFSSRRRHTRCSRDWSSDVCSSDLGSEPRSLAVTIVRYTPQAVLVANVEEARYRTLVAEDGRVLVEARYAEIGRASCRERV